jgi:hypothetical protein
MDIARTSVVTPRRITSVRGCTTRRWKIPITNARALHEANGLSRRSHRLGHALRAAAHHGQADCNVCPHGARYAGRGLRVCALMPRLCG